MKTIRQLLREFWLPLLLGAAWTAFNVIDRPRSQWSTRQTLNIFGPTFFFMSWLVAQWYRIRKQLRVEDELDEIHAGVRAIHEPLLPCSLFLTLQVKVSESELEKLFKDQPGYRAYEPGRPPLPVPFGLPPGVQDGRMMRQDGYIDFQGGAVEAAGIFRLEHPGYNMIESAVRHTVSSIPADSKSKSLLQSGPLFAPASVQVDLFRSRPVSPEVVPSLTLKSSWNSVSVVDAYALDELVIVNVVVTQLPASVGGSSTWSSQSLKGAYIKATLDFFDIKELNAFEPSNWPTLRNLQLWLGASARQVLTFTPEQLDAQVIDSPDPFMKGTEHIRITFEHEIDANTFAQGLLFAT
jgi:hypothetical protein